jgi:hypothetical protein
MQVRGTSQVRRFASLLIVVSLIAGSAAFTTGVAEAKSSGGQNVEVGQSKATKHSVTSAALAHARQELLRLLQVVKLCKDWRKLFRSDGKAFKSYLDCTLYGAKGGTILTQPPAPPAPGLPNLVVVNPPSATAGSYEASGAAFGPALTAAGVNGEFALVNSSVGVPSQGCGPLFGFPPGAIAVVDRGGCSFVDQVANAQAAGAAAVVVVNNVAGAPVMMDGSAPTIAIPSMMVSLNDGTLIKVGIPATGTVRAKS